MIRKSSRSLVPKKSFDEYLSLDQIIFDKHHSTNRNNIESNDNKFKIKPEGKIINISGNDIIELKSVLDQQVLDSDSTSSGIPRIHHINQYQNPYFGYKDSCLNDIINHNNSYQELSSNSYIACLESLIEIDAINSIKRILITSDDIWSLCPAKIADELERNSKRLLSKSVKRMIECIVIAFTHEILMATQNTSGKPKNIQRKDIKKINSNNSMKFDDEYDVEVESNALDYDINYYNQMLIKNKFKRHESNIIGWRVPIKPIKYLNEIDESNVFTVLDPNDLKK